MASPIENLIGTTVINNKKSTTDVKAFCGSNKYVGLYFSAHWCPPCRGFTPELAKFYNKLKQSEKADQFEIVFISSDKDEASWMEYFSEMPWLALPFSDRDRKQQLGDKFGVRGIPTLVLLDAGSGEVVLANARSNVIGDPDATNFPWK